MLDDHIKEEERGIFEELGEHFTDEQRDAMGADFAAPPGRIVVCGWRPGHTSGVASVPPLKPKRLACGTETDNWRET